MLQESCPRVIRMLSGCYKNHQETLDQCGFIIRMMGNSGAHGDDDYMLTGRDIAALIDFIETIMYYIYELPVKIDNFNRKYELKLEEREESTSESTG